MAKRTSTKNKTTLNGTNAADTLTVKHSQITVNAGKGNDKINVTKGSSHKIYGEAGKDTITIGAKAGSGTKIYGDDAKNKLTGNDTFNINGGKKNYFYGGKGTDTFNINGGTSNYIYGDEGVDTFNINGGTTNNLYGGAGNDVFVIGKSSTGKAVVKDFSVTKGNTDSVKVTGGAVKDIAVSGKNNIVVKGGKNASLTLQDAKSKTFTVTDTLGNYTVKGSNVKLTLGKNVKGTLTAASFITTVDARSNANVLTIKGNAKNNTIYGGAGSNILNGGGGNDTLYGGTGWDTFVYESGSDTFYNFDPDSDRIQINNTTMNGYSRSVNDIVLTFTNRGTLKVKNIADGGFSIDTDDGRFELGSSEDNYIYGGAGNDLLAGGAGNDHLEGGAGNNILYGEDGNDTLFGGFYGGKNGNNTLIGGKGQDQFYVYFSGNTTIKDYTENEDLLTFYSNGKISGTQIKDNNVIFTVADNYDTDNDETGIVTLENAVGKVIRFGDPEPNYSNFTVSATEIRLMDGYNGGVVDANAYFDSITTIDASAAEWVSTVIGNDQGNTIYGGNFIATYQGGKGNDEIYGGDWQSTLIGGEGNDTLYGGTGWDTFVYESGSDTIYDLDPDSDRIQINNATINGFVRSDNDITLTLTNNGELTVKNIADGGFSIDTDDGRFELGSSEDNYIYGGAGNDLLAGGAGNDHLEGGAGNNILYGEDGNDTLFGGFYGGKNGNNTLIGGKGQDQFYVYFSGNTTIKDYTENEDLLTFYSNGKISGTQIKDNNVIFTVADNYDTDNDETGIVTLENAVGKVIRFGDPEPNYSNFTVSATEIRLMDGYNGGVVDANAYFDSITTIDASAAEWVSTVIGNDQGNTIYGGNFIATYRGGKGNDEIYGGDWNDTLIGGDGNDMLYGGEGSDTLTGGDGNDTLDGGEGRDTLTGGAGNDIFVFGSGNDEITDYTNNTSETDILRIEGTAISNVSQRSDEILVNTTNGGQVTLTGVVDSPVKIEDSHGIYTVTNLTSDPTVTLDGHDSDGMFDASDLSFVRVIDASGTTESITVTGNAKNNTIYAGAGDKTLAGGAGNDTFVYSSGHDTITDYANNAEEKDVLRIEGNSVSDAALDGTSAIFTVGSGSVTVTDAADKAVRIEDGRGSYSISNMATALTVTLDDDYTGSSFDAGSLVFIKNIDAADSAQAMTITGNANNNVICAGQGGTSLNGGTGDDSLIVDGRFCDTLTGGTGSDTYVVSKKLASDTVLTINQGDYQAGDSDGLQLQSINKEDVIYRMQDDVLTIMHSSGGIISVTDWDTNPLRSVTFANGSVSNAEIDARVSSSIDETVTQQSVIKSFMRSLDDTTMIVGDSDEAKTAAAKSALDVAVSFASNYIYTSWDGLVSSFMNDINTYAKMEEGNDKDWLTVTNSEGERVKIVEPGIDRFLQEYCGITLLNDDTGAITGSDAGGATVKTAESIVPEEGTLSDLVPADPSANTINGLTFHWPGTPTAQQQTIINAINTWWAEKGLDLLEESYGLSFTEEETTVTDISVKFVTENTGTMAKVDSWGIGDGTANRMELTINMKYYNEILDENGASDGTSEYLDRTLAHELTHAVMVANITNFKYLPKCLKEGSAELVHGVDDVRTDEIIVLANQSLHTEERSKALQEAMQFDGDSYYAYAGGYMLLRYFAKQVADAWNGESLGSSCNMLASDRTGNSSSSDSLLNLASIQADMIDFAATPVSGSLSGMQQEEANTDSLFITGNV